MTRTRQRALILATAGCAVLLALQGAAQVQGHDQGRPVFAPPTRIKAGDAFLGEGRYYPSPVLHDVDGDGLLDIVVGDLFGKVTFAPRLAQSGPNSQDKQGRDAILFGAERELRDRDGKPLKFDNW